MATAKELMGLSMVPQLARVLGGNWWVCASDEDLRIAISRGRNIVISSEFPLTANRTISTQLLMLQGGKITLGAYNLAINGDFSAGWYQVFDDSGAGAVTFGTHYAGPLYCEWWGAPANGTSSDTAALVKALAAKQYPIVEFRYNKTYRIDNVTLPERSELRGQRFLNGSPTLKSEGANACVKFTAGETYNRLRGLIVNGNSTASSCVDFNGSSYNEIEGCVFLNATNNVQHSGYFNVFRGINKIGAGTTGLNILPGSNYLTIEGKLIFTGAMTRCVDCDASNLSDTLRLTNLVMEATSATDYIRIRTTSGFQGISALIEHCRGDGTPSNAMLNIGQYCQVTVRENSLAGATVNLIKCDGTNCRIDDNYLASSSGAAIALTSNSSNCYVGPQKYGVSGSAPASQISDAGTNNTIYLRVDKGASGSRPTPLATGQMGAMYLDTTIDADGLPIFWQGTKWIKADGTDA